MMRRWIALFMIVATASMFMTACGGKESKRNRPKNYKDYKSGTNTGSESTAKSDMGGSGGDGNFGPAGGQMPTTNCDDIAKGVANSGSIKGQVKYKGKARKPKPIDMSKDPWCAKNHVATYEDLLVSDSGGLKNVVVYVSKGLNKFEFQPPSSPALLDQRGCKYIPHVLCLVAGQELQVRNSDDTSHNYHFTSQLNDSVNKTQPKPATDIVDQLQTPDLSGAFQCDIHGWMKAPTRIFAHPYWAVTDDEGNFEIKNLPAGTYEISFLHERGSLKAPSQSITVSAGQAAMVNATMGK
ncbi:MAG TPA: hypothetical protein ENK43_13125 [Planctomycetes bacterium]|nr:hypothetical protein [Planctomycetota bacterium]